MIILTALFMLQAAVPVKPEPKETLTTTEQLAARQLITEITQINQNVGNFEGEITKAHPGYTFNFQTNTLVKIQPPAQTAPAPAPTKVAPKVEKPIAKK